ncbi:MAG: trehalose-6-phosphate synthase [Candidatus Aenigmatarchaeota archaeon]
MYNRGTEHPYNDGIIFVSNRGPFRIVNGEYILTKGGLVSATLGLMKDGNSSWVTAAEEVGSNPVYRHTDKDYNFTWKTVHTSAEIVKSFYQGFCNNFLWPALHYRNELLESRTFPRVIGDMDISKQCGLDYNGSAMIEFNASDYDDYTTANINFAQAIKQEYRDVPRPIWVQDYHFLLAPRIMRTYLKGVRDVNVQDVPIALFMHVPFFSKDTRALLNTEELWKQYGKKRPRREIAVGMLGADLIGFHTPEYVHDFAAFIEETIPKTKISESDEFVVISYKKDGKTNQTYVGAFPIGLEVEKILDAAKSDSLSDVDKKYLKMDELIKKRKSEGATVICGLGRMDYTKGILESLNIIEEMLERGMNVQYIGYWSPSRENIPGYDFLKDMVFEKANSINNRFKHDDVLHVVIKNEEIKYPDNMMFLRDASIVMVPSLKDGFHLVPVEAMLANSHLPYDQRALVVMSHDCGASYALDRFDENDGLLRISPIRTNESVDKILRAYEKNLRISDPLLDFAKGMDVKKWQAANMNALYEVKERKKELVLC